MKKITTLLAVFAVIVSTLGCILPATPTLASASTPPALPKYVAPSATPTYAPLPRMNPGDKLTLTDGSGKFYWIEYLGNASGYDLWNCISNAPGQETDCKGSDLEVHQNFFWWGGQQVAFNGDDGFLHLYGNWHVTTPADKPTMP